MVMIDDFVVFVFTTERAYYSQDEYHSFVR